MCQIDVCTCTRLFETMPGVQPPSRLLPLLRPTNQPTPSPPPLVPNHPSPLPPSRPVALVLFHEAATILTVPCQPLPLTYIRSATDHPHLACRPYRCRATPVNTASPLLPSTTRTTIHSFPPVAYAGSSSSLNQTLAFLSFPFCFHFRLPQTPDPIHPGRRVRPPWRKYENTSAVSQRECDNTKNFD